MFFTDLKKNQLRYFNIIIIDISFRNALFYICVAKISAHTKITQSNKGSP